MKSFFNSCMLGVLVLASVGYGTAQNPAPGGFRHGGNMDFMAREMGSRKVVTGAPFTAQAVTQTSQTLPNGTHISHNLTATLYRDSQGRTRREETLGGAGPLASNGGAPRQMVLIHDPVAAAEYALNPQNKTARKMAFNPTHHPGRQSTSTGEDATAAVAPREGHGQRFSVKTESLGTQVIDGLSVEGTRRTMTIPAGAFGNDQAIESVSERWYSADLQVVVKSVHTDPRFGQTTYQLTNIQRSEPSAALFQVPTDYAVTAGGRGADK